MITVTAIAARAALATPFTPAQLRKNLSLIPIALYPAVPRNTEIGLATRIGETRIIASLSPVKEREILLIGPTRWVDDDDFGNAISGVLETYTRTLGVQSFNLALFQRPIDAVQEDWSGFPAIVRVVDRGDPQSRTADVGCMELYGSSVISADPFDVVRAVIQDAKETRIDGS